MTKSTQPKTTTITPFKWVDPATIEPIGMTADLPLEEIDPKIMGWVRQAIAAREIVETEAGSAPVNNANAPATDDRPAFAFTPYVPQDPAQLPRRDWLFGRHYIRKFVSVTVSPGGLGKTSNSIVEALSMVSGKPLLELDGAGGVSERLRVALYNGEDPRDEMARRIEGARLRYKLAAGDLAGIFLDVGREQQLIVVREDRRAGVNICEPIVEAVVEHITANRIDVMIVDPFVSTHQVNENDNGAIDTVAKLWGQIADRTNCSIELVHHLRKLNDKEATIDDARGAIALIGAARSVRLLNRMTEKDATAAGIPMQDAASHFYVISGKANMTKQDNHRDWRKLESVGLGNSAGLTKPQDHVGVVVPWHFPSKAETAEKAASEVTPDQKELIMVRLENQTWVPGKTSPRWAGKLIMDIMSLDASEKCNWALADKILSSWRADGTVAVEEEKDNSRHAMQVIRPA